MCLCRSTDRMRSYELHDSGSIPLGGTKVRNVEVGCSSAVEQPAGEGRWFESTQPYAETFLGQRIDSDGWNDVKSLKPSGYFGPIVQWNRTRGFEPRNVGSSPTGTTKVLQVCRQRTPRALRTPSPSGNAGSSPVTCSSWGSYV